MSRSTLCTCDGTRHDRDPRCPPDPAARAIAEALHTSTTTMQVLDSQGRWVDVSAPLDPYTPHTIRYLPRSRS